MSLRSLILESKKLVVSGAVAAGTTAVNGTAVDRQNAENVTFTAVLGDVTDTSVLTLKAQQGDASDGSDAVDIAGASVTFTAGATNADSKILALEVVKPTKRYVRAVLTRGTANAVVAAITADVWGYRFTPPAAGDVIGSKVHVVAT